ncbi:MAG TPA: ABC transporter permease [Candidatus Kapabacteria bacterium]|nr:ABC transporter permease [Candidatus Kapabacteria bacterium]
MNGNRLAMQIALRHLRARRRQTILATLGIVIGGGIFALMVAITAGEQDFLEERLIDVSPHITLTSDRLQPLTAQNLLREPSQSPDSEQPDAARHDAVIELRRNVPPQARKELKPYPELQSLVEHGLPDAVAVAPFVAMDGAIRNGTQSQMASVRGIDPVRERAIAHLAANVVAGRLEDLAQRPDGVVLGSGLARKLHTSVGGTCSMVTSSGTMQPLTVTGIFESRIASLDDHRAYINLATAQRLRGLSRTAASGLSVRVRDIDRVAEAGRMLQRLTGFRTETWRETNAQILASLERQGAAVRLLAILVFVTAAFGIANMLVRIVLEKKPDIAIMKSFGMPRGVIARTILFEGAIIGGAGGVLAAGVGYGVALLCSNIQLISIASDQADLRFDRFPVALDPAIFVMAFGLSMFMAIAASVLPARRAARFVPVQIIRGEG